MFCVSKCLWNKILYQPKRKRCKNTKFNKINTFNIINTINTEYICNCLSLVVEHLQNLIPLQMA